MNETYVAIYPYSTSNPTAKFRVAKFEDWRAAIDGGKTSYPFTAYDKYDQAIAARDKLNKRTVDEETQG